MASTELADYVVAITHDLRTPLTSIRGFADVLQRGGDRISDADRLDYLARITTAAARLDELIAELSTAAKAHQSS
jgi:two-component system sensor histidine kinase MprB